MSKTSKGWHFLPANGRLRYRPHTLVVPGVWLRAEGDIVPCENGMHHSERAIDALCYAPGPVLCRTKLRGELQYDGGDKVVGRERRVVWMLSAEQGEALLRYCARKWALDVVHLWNAPDVVLRWLLTGDELSRGSAWAAAREAAREAALDTAEYAALAAVRAAAETAALAAKRDAARTAQNADLERYAQMLHQGKPLPKLRLSKEACAKYPAFRTAQ